ncbi:MAG: endonuclease/exonuclease/phosphatase [Chlorobi bacterium]|nr:endonuclease/exonuclease/phosphatase [Chlorobiota bacterium]
MTRLSLLTAFLLSLACIAAGAQEIDSSLQYRPMAIGDKWYYQRVHHAPRSDTSYATVEITGDTLMPNGQRYFIVEQHGRILAASPDNRRYFRRIDSASGVVYDYNSRDMLVDSLRCWDNDLFSSPHPHFCGMHDYNTSPPRRWFYGDPDGSPSASFPYIATRGEAFLYGLGLIYALEDDPLHEEEWVTSLTHARINGREITELAVDEPTAASAGLQVMANVPEPFTTGTDIRFLLGTRSHATAMLVDLTGRTIATLADGVMDAGEHHVWLNGAGLAGGSYLCVLRSGGRQVSRVIHLRR